MALALVVELPRNLDAENIEENIIDTVESLLRKQGLNSRTVPTRVKESIVPVVGKQVSSLLRRDHGIFWNLGESNARLIGDNFEDEEAVEDMRENVLNAIKSSIEAASFFVTSAIISLSALGYPEADSEG